jgi:hypothetical protein
MIIINYLKASKSEKSVNKVEEYTKTEPRLSFLQGLKLWFDLLADITKWLRKLNIILLLIVKESGILTLDSDDYRFQKVSFTIMVKK